MKLKTQNDSIFDNWMQAVNQGVCRQLPDVRLVFEQRGSRGWSHGGTQVQVLQRGMSAVVLQINERTRAATLVDTINVVASDPAPDRQ